MILQVDNQEITVLEKDKLVSGSVNTYVASFTFSEQWTGYAKVAVFQVYQGKEYEVLLVNDMCPIPWEALMSAGFLKIGCYGVYNDVRLPTVYTRYMPINKGSSERLLANEPTPTIYEQILTMTQNTLAFAQTLLPKDMSGLAIVAALADDAIFPMKSGSTTYYCTGAQIKTFVKDTHNLGWFINLAALQTAKAVGTSGDWAILGSTDTIWAWDADTNQYLDTDRKGAVTTVNGATGAVVITAASLGALVPADIVNDLTTGGIAKPLSAEQGKIMKAYIDSMSASDTILQTYIADTDYNQNLPVANLDGTISMAAHGYVNDTLMEITNGRCVVITNMVSGSAIITLKSITGITVGNTVRGIGLTGTPTVLSIDVNAKTVTLSSNATVTTTCGYLEFLATGVPPTLSYALTGTASITNGSATVTGVGTQFSSELFPGSTITINGETRTVTSISSSLTNTQCAVSVPFTSNASGQVVTAILLPVSTSNRFITCNKMYVWTRDKTTDNFKIAFTKGGAAINITNVGSSGWCIRKAGDNKPILNSFNVANTKRNLYLSFIGIIYETQNAAYIMITPTKGGAAFTSINLANSTSGYVINAQVLTGISISPVSGANFNLCYYDVELKTSNGKIMAKANINRILTGNFYSYSNNLSGFSHSKLTGYDTVDRIQIDGDGDMLILNGSEVIIRGY